MKKRLFVSVIALSIVLYTIAFATDTAEFDFGDDKNISSEALGFCEYPEGRALLFENETPQGLDYSLLNNVLTIEVKNEEAAENYSLIVVEYNAADAPVNVHIIDDVRSENVIGRVYGAYEKAFLWDLDDMSPACQSISTKTDYAIVEGTEGDWEVSPDGHCLYSYQGSDTDVIIPNSYRGKRITAIYNQPAVVNKTSETTYAELSLFGGRTDIESFVISEGVARLGPCAFASCGASCPISLPDTVTYIGNYAFRGCSNLTGSVDLSAVTTLQQNGGFQFAYCSGLNGTLTLPCVETIPKSAFYDCRNLTGAINIPSGVKVIDDYAFSCTGAGKFTSLTLPSTLERIGKSAFQYQTRIGNGLVLPEGLKHIGDAAFNHCRTISNTVLTIPSTLESIGGDSTDSGGNYVNTGYGCHVFYDSFKNVVRYEVASGSRYFKAVNGVLYSKDGTRLVTYPPAKTDTEFVIPEGVTQIDEMAFGYSKFRTLTLPDSYIISETVPANIVNNKANTLAVAMYHYNSLQSVLVKSTNTNYTSVDGIIYSRNKTRLWYVPPKITGGIYVEAGCTNLMSGSCWMESNDYDGELYTSIYIPASVSSIHANTLADLNRKTNNSQIRFIINLDSANSSFTINQEGRICPR